MRVFGPRSFFEQTKRRLKRAIAQIERLEVRSMLTVQPLTAADVAFQGETGNADSGIPSISVSGNVVAFSSESTNLLAGVTVAGQIYAFNQTTGALKLVTATTTGGPSAGNTADPVVSADGRYVLFYGDADDLVPQNLGSNSNIDQVFVRDLQSDTTTLISLSADGVSAGNNDSGGSGSGGINSSLYVISGNGRFVLFTSLATNLVSPAPVNPHQLYVRDLVANTTRLVSIGTDGNPAASTGGFNAGRYESLSISDDGRYISYATNVNGLVPGDTNESSDVFIRDLLQNTTQLVSAKAGSAVPGDGVADRAAMSKDGTKIFFISTASDLVVGAQLFLQQQLYVRDLTTGVTSLVSQAAGNPNQGGTGGVTGYSISDNGQFVALESSSDNFVARDNNDTNDIFLRDLSTGTTTLVSHSHDGNGSNGLSFTPIISGDGSTIVFGSRASNLVAGFTDNNTSQPDNYVFHRSDNSIQLLTSDRNNPTAGGNSADDISNPTVYAALSDDGTSIAFQNLSSNLVLADNNQALDVFLRKQTGTQAVSRRDTTLPAAFAAGGSARAASADGRYIVVAAGPDFQLNSNAGLYLHDTVDGSVTPIPGSENVNFDVATSISPDGRFITFIAGQVKLFDRVGGTTEIISKTPNETNASGSFFSTEVSGDGRYGAFTSNSTDLIAGFVDGNGSSSDLFLRDRQIGTTVLVNRKQGTTVTGGNGNVGQSLHISSNGQFVFFDTTASDLTPNDTNGINGRDIYSFNVSTGAMTLISATQAGAAAGMESSFTVSADSRYVAFVSRSDSLVSGMTGTLAHVYVRDLQTGINRLVDVSSTGVGAGDASASVPQISPDGRFVLFNSSAKNLTADFPSPGSINVYVRDLVLNQTTLVSASLNGVSGGNRDSKTDFDADRQISPNGRYVAFESSATNLVPNFVVGTPFFTTDLYVRDLQTGVTRLISKNRAGTASGNDRTTASSGPFIVLDDGRIIFTSYASDLAAVFDANELTDAFLDDPLAPSGGLLRGTVFEDSDSDGTRDAGENGVFNALVYLDSDQDGIHDPNEISVRTNGDGTYSLAGVPLGSHQVRQEFGPETQLTTPVNARHTVNVTNDGQLITNLDFGNTILRSDLTIGNVVVQEPSAIRGTIQVTWTVTNSGAIATNVSAWQDAIYLSKTPTLGPDAILLTTTARTGNLNAGGSYVGQATVGVNVTDDPFVPYYVIVQADRLHVVSETQEANNSAASVALTLEIPELELGVTTSDIFSLAGVPHYFQMSSDFNQALRLRLDALQGVTELYVRRGAVPTAWLYDFRATNGSPDQELAIPVQEDETYFVMVRAIVPADVNQRAFTLLADPVSFLASSADVTSADRGGSITIGLSGVDFWPGMNVELRDATGNTFVATDVNYVSSIKVFATFNLTQVPTGVYDVRLSQTRREFYYAVLAGDNENPVQIVDTPQFATLPGAFTVTDARPDSSRIDIIVPQNVRSGREFEIQVNYTNTGTHDIAVPVLEVKFDRDLVLASALATGGAYQHESINILPLSRLAPYVILRPGEVATAQLRSRSNNVGGEFSITVSPTQDNGQPIDFTEFVQSLGNDPLTGIGAVQLQRLQSQYGSTYESMAEGLRSWAERAARAGVPLTTTVDLFMDTAYRDAPLSPSNGALTAQMQFGQAAITLSEQGESSPGASAPLNDTSTGSAQPMNEGSANSVSTPPSPSAPPAPTGPNYDPNSEFNIAGGGPNLPLTAEQLIKREIVLGSVAAGFVSAGAPTGALHLLRFLGAPGPSAGGGDPAKYGPDDLIAAGLRADYLADVSYGILNTIVQQYIKDRVKNRADSLPEGTTEVTETFVGLPLNFYVGGYLPIGIPISFDLAVAFGRVLGTAEIPLKITKKKDHCGGDKVSYEGTLTYTFKDEYGFKSDGGSDISRIINGYAQNLQEAGYAGAFSTEIKMEEDVDGELHLPPKKPLPPDCEPEIPKPPKPPGINGVSARIFNLLPLDPNEIVGPGGFGPDHYRQSDNAAYPYVIRYENDPEQATAPAQEVIITHQLDTDHDWSTFELGTFGFGDLNVNVPAGLQDYQTRVTYHNQDNSPLFVDFSASLNRQTGMVTWAMRSVDPETGALPDGVFDGFLPVNDDSARGEGFVQYAIQPKSNLASGTRFDHQASIIFDINDPILTNVFTNIIDDLTPASSVGALAATSGTTTFPVTWTGNDGSDGSGIATFDVFVSDNDGAYSLWLDNTTLNTSNFVGQNGHTYRFYTVATDNVGLTELAPPVADATTSVNVVPQLQIGGPAVTWTKKDPPVSVVPQLIVGESNDLGGGVLTISMNAVGKKKALDVLSTPVPGSLGTGGTVEFSNGRLRLQIQLNPNVTSASIQTFLRGITFQTRGTGLKSATRTLDISISNAAGQTATALQTINVRKKAPKPLRVRIQDERVSIRK